MIRNELHNFQTFEVHRSYWTTRTKLTRPWTFVISNLDSVTSSCCCSRIANSSRSCSLSSCQLNLHKKWVAFSNRRSKRDVDENMTREKSINMAGHLCESKEEVIVINIFFRALNTGTPELGKLPQQVFLVLQGPLFNFWFDILEAAEADAILKLQSGSISWACSLLTRSL